MGKITKKEIIETYLLTHPNATETQIFEELKKGKVPFTLPYVRKCASIWRHSGRKKNKDDDIELDSELESILKIMLYYKKKGVRVQFREIHEYLKHKGSITLEAEEQKLAVKKLSNDQLLALILGDQSSVNES